jgi:anion transporter
MTFVQNPIFLTLGVLGATLIAFVAEWLPIDLTALFVAIALIVLGLVTPEEGVAGFSNPATITVMAMFILSAGISRTGVILVVRDWLVKWGGKTANQQILILGLVVGPITALISNTAVVAVFLPIVEDWCKKQGISPSKLLIPLSYTAVLGGMITLIGSSSNILASSMSKALGYGEFRLLQFTTVGLITFAVGLVYLALFAPWLLPDRPSTSEALEIDALAEPLRTDKAWVAIAITLIVVIVSAFNWMPIMVSALVGVALMVVTGCLDPNEIYSAVRWDIIFLLAGLLPLGTAMDKSGATQWLAAHLLSIGTTLSGFWVLTFFYISTTLLTEILSNNAAVVLMIPVAAEVGKTLGLNPLAFIYAVTFAASNSYLTPIGYQTNTMVYGPGGYKFLDFTRVGAPLNLILTILTPTLIVWLYGL